MDEKSLRDALEILRKARLDVYEKQPRRVWLFLLDACTHITDQLETAYDPMMESIFGDPEKAATL